MNKSKRSIEHMCKVIKHVVVPSGEMVFDYRSQGELFYMVLHGEVDCKIKQKRQLMYLSP